MTSASWKPHETFAAKMGTADVVPSDNVETVEDEKTPVEKV